MGRVTTMGFKPLPLPPLRVVEGSPRKSAHEAATDECLAEAKREEARERARLAHAERVRLREDRRARARAARMKHLARGKKRGFWRKLWDELYGMPDAWRDYEND